jgi:hypothetical protein
LVLSSANDEDQQHKGKTTLIQANPSSKPLKRKIVASEKDASKVNSILEEFDLDNHPAVAKAQPAAVALVRPEDIAAGGYRGKCAD